jgi:hypothetical protein
MNEILNIIQRFVGSLVIWIVVSPWQQAVRVRLGKYVKVLEAGPHWKLPFIDVVYVQSVRKRTASLGRQTITNRDSVTITFSGSVSYSITNIAQLYQTLHHAEDVVMSIARHAVVQYISTHGADDCTPEAIAKSAAGTIDLRLYGLADPEVYLFDFAVVRTFRIIGDYSSYSTGSVLDTERPANAHQPGSPPTAW